MALGPFTRTPQALGRALESALNTYLGLDSDAARPLREIAGKVIALELRGPGIKLFIIPVERRVRVLTRFDHTPDTLIRGTPAALAGAALRSGAGGLPETLEITGDVEAGQRLRAVLQAVEIDWEELLAKGVGDIAAHQLGNVARGLQGWASRTGESMRLDVSEYLQEEARLMPTRVEVEGFMREVDALRDDVARLEARLVRLSTPKVDGAGSDPRKR